MRRSAMMIVAGLMLVVGSAFAAWAPDTTPGGISWNFNDGLQGWTLSGSAGATWVDPLVYPNGIGLPDGNPSGAGGGNLYLPDGGKAEIDVSSYMLGNGPGKNGFQLTCRVYVPNLQPLTGFTYGYPGNMIEKAGLAALRDTDGKEMYVGGDISQGRVRAKDRTWDNINRGPGWTIESNTTPWWDDWVTLAFDYNYSVAGKWNAAAYIPWDGPTHTAGWVTLAENIDCSADVTFSKLRMGSVDGNSWTQAQFDDVNLKVVPEPTGMLALGSGLMGLLGLVRRRR